MKNVSCFINQQQYLHESPNCESERLDRAAGIMKFPNLLHWATLTLAHAISPVSDQIPLSANDHVEINPFNYTGLGGPLTWVGLNYSANEACGKGSHQSPVNIVTSSIEYASPLGMSLNLSTIDGAKFENLGSGLQVSLLQGSLLVEGTAYDLKQLHFHTPSEHRVDEEYFPMECHFVFQDEGKLDPFFSGSTRWMLTPTRGE
jgi:carbonic anhydrase